MTAVRKDGRREQRPFSREGGALEVDLGGPVDAFDHLEVSWPSSRLRDVTLVDTPGIASLSTEVSERTSTLLSAEDDRPPVVDAVLYLFRHTHASDVRFLEAFHDDELGRGTPLNAVGVLSRPDEIGSCRLDALTVAARVADRYERDPRIHRLCPLVLPVAGLLGQAGTTLREEEFRALATIAALPEDVCNELLLTADRLLADDADVLLTPLERAHLAERLGLFGVRLSVMLIRNRTVRSATELAQRLAADSGLEELRGVLVRQFLERSRLLRARSALATVRAVLRRGGCADADRIDARVEEVMAAAHEFVEVRLLTDLRTGTVAVAERLEEEMDRLLGGSGHSIARRLGLPDDSSVPQLLDAAYGGAGPLAAGRVVAADQPGGEDRGPRCGADLRGDRGGARPGPRLTPIPGATRTALRSHNAVRRPWKEQLAPKCGPRRPAAALQGRTYGSRTGPPERRGRPAGRCPRRTRRPGRRCRCPAAAG